MRASVSFVGTWQASSQPTTSVGGSRRSRASPLTSSFAKPGLPIPNASLINPLQQRVGLLIPSFPALNVEVVTVLRPLVIIFNSDDVVFAEIAAGLHLN